MGMESGWGGDHPCPFWNLPGCDGIRLCALLNTHGISLRNHHFLCMLLVLVCIEESEGVLGMSG
jgi:hypothetical protein